MGSSSSAPDEGPVDSEGDSARNNLHDVRFDENRLAWWWSNII